MTTLAAAVRPATGAVAPIPFHRLLRVEWRKSVDTRAARWLLFAVLLMSAAAAAVPLLMWKSIDQTLPVYLNLVILGVTILLPVVSILMLTVEWSRRTVLSTFTQEPRRGRVLGAKLLAGLVLAATGALVGLGLAAGSLAISDALGHTVSWDITTKHVVGYFLVVVLNTLMGMAFGALLHNTAAAIVLFFALPTVMSIAGFALKKARDWVDTATTFGWILSGDWSGHTGQILTSLAIWIVAPLAVGLVYTLRREVQ